MLCYNGVIRVASMRWGGCASEPSAIYPLCCCGARVHGALLNKETEATKQVWQMQTCMPKCTVNRQMWQCSAVTFQNK